MAIKTKKEKKEKLTAAKKNILGNGETSAAQSSENKRAPFAVVEAYKSIRTNLMFLLAQNNGKVIALSSANAGEGKSTTSVNIAIAFAQLGGKVLLIDGDLRRSSIHKKMKLENDIGLSNVLAGFNDLSEAIVSVNQNLDVITSGQIPPNPSELLGSELFAQAMEKLKDEYNYIIIDTPPINVVTDALIVAPHTDGLVLIVRDGFTQNESIRRALDAAEFANINILGAIMNGADTKKSKRYSYRRNDYRYYRYSRGFRYGYGGYGGYGGHGGYGSYGGYGYGYGYGPNYGYGYGYRNGED